MSDLGELICCTMNRSGSIRFSGYFGAGILNIAYNSYRYWCSSIPARAPLDYFPRGKTLTFLKNLLA
jgi:hypothetical protein